MPSRQLNLLPLSLKPFKTSNPDSVEGGQLAKLKHISASSDIQDLIPLGSRRILAVTGIQGSSNFSVQNGVDPNSGGQPYPTKDKVRTRIITKNYLTPGMNLSYVGLFVPSGPTNVLNGMGAYEEDTRYGAIKMSTSWDNGVNTYTTVSEISIKSSSETYGAEPNFYLPGGLQLITGSIARPPSVKTSDFSNDVEVTIVLSGVGSVRIVDFVIFETSKNATIITDDTHRETVYHGAQHVYPSEYAITATQFTGDARFGARQRLKTIYDQRQYLGPSLFQWSSWDEDSISVTDSEADPVNISSTSFVNINYSSLTTYSDTYPGFSMSSGCHGRCSEWSGILELREKTGVIPVVIRVYALVPAGRTGTLRFQTAPHSYCDLEITNSGYDWVEGLAWLQVPVSQNIKSVLQIFGKISSGAVASFNIRYINIHYGGHHTLSE